MINLQKQQFHSKKIHDLVVRVDCYRYRVIPLKTIVGVIMCSLTFIGFCVAEVTNWFDLVKRKQKHRQNKTAFSTHTEHESEKTVTSGIELIGFNLSNK